MPRQGRHRALDLVLYELYEEGRGELFGVSDSWRSYTPHLLARHPKPDGRDSAEEQIRRECFQRGLPEPQITHLPEQPRTYWLTRGPRRGPPGKPGYFALRFPQPVTGPLSLGKSAHFGMGRFVPESF